MNSITELREMIYIFSDNLNLFRGDKEIILNCVIQIITYPDTSIAPADLPVWKETNF